MTCDVDALKALLDDAQAAYHALQTGQQPRVFVDQNGERVEYTVANRLSLLAYIKTLQSQIAGQASCTGTPSGPVRFLF